MPSNIGFVRYFSFEIDSSTITSQHIIFNYFKFELFDYIQNMCLFSQWFNHVIFNIQLIR